MVNIHGNYKGMSYRHICLFILFMGFSRQEYWSGLPFSSPVDHVLWPLLHGPHDPSILGGPTWHGSQSHWVRQGCGPCDQFSKFSVIVVFTLPALLVRIRGLWKLPDGKDWLRGKTDLVLMGGAMLSKYLIWFSVDGQSCVPSLLFSLRANPCLHQRLLDTHRQVWHSLLWGHCSFLLAPGAHTESFVCALQESVSPVLWKFYNEVPLASKVKLTGGSCLLTGSMVGLTATSSKSIYATCCMTQVCCR